MKLFTTGFTNKSACRFFDLLLESRVKRILGVRINNGPQLAGFAKKDDLSYFLEKICGMDYVHLPDVGAHGLGPRLGLEMYKPRKPSNLDYWLTSGRNAWRPVVDYLEEMKWCLPEKGDGLRAFPGIERIFDENGMSILYKGINHFKLSIEGDAVEAKAYAALAYFRLYAPSEEESEPPES